MKKQQMPNELQNRKLMNKESQKRRLQRPNGKQMKKLKINVLLKKRLRLKE
jgi:hypothetical protein